MPLMWRASGVFILAQSVKILQPGAAVERCDFILLGEKAAGPQFTIG